MCKLVKKIWYSISLQQKLLAFASIVTVVLVVSSFFNFKLVEFSIDGFSDILNDNARCVPSGSDGRRTGCFSDHDAGRHWREQTRL